MCPGDRELPLKGIASRGHLCIRFDFSDGATLLICQLRESYSSHGRLKRLAEFCSKRPSRFGSRVWSVVSRGKRPKRPLLKVRRPLEFGDLEAAPRMTKHAGSYSVSEEDDRWRDVERHLSESAALGALGQSSQEEGDAAPLIRPGLEGQFDDQHSD